jgi:hypothetical protein
MVIASMRAITLDWLSPSKFGSARLTSQDRVINAEMIMGDYRGLTESPADLSGEMCCRPGLLASSPDPTALHLGL